MNGSMTLFVWLKSKKLETKTLGLIHLDLFSLPVYFFEQCQALMPETRVR